MAERIRLLAAAAVFRMQIERSAGEPGAAFGVFATELLNSTGYRAKSGKAVARHVETADLARSAIRDIVARQERPDATAALRREGKA
jgi:hypothetical protein